MDAASEAMIDRFQACYMAGFRKTASAFDMSAKFGITRPQFYIMSTLNQEGICKATKLAEMMEVKPSAITVMIDRLVRLGQVTRQLDENDRRVVLLKLTEDGIETLVKAKAHQRALIAEQLFKLDLDELESFIRTFEKIML